MDFRDIVNFFAESHRVPGWLIVGGVIILIASLVAAKRESR